MSPPESSSSFLHTTQHGTEFYKILFHEYLSIITHNHGGCATSPLLKPPNRGFRTDVGMAGNDSVCSERTLREPPVTPRSRSPHPRRSRALGSHYGVTRRLNFQAQDFPAGSTFFSEPSDRQEGKPNACHEAHGDSQLIPFNEEFPKHLSREGSANPIR